MKFSHFRRDKTVGSTDYAHVVVSRGIWPFSSEREEFIYKDWNDVWRIANTGEFVDITNQVKARDAIDRYHGRNGSSGKVPNPPKNR